MATALVSLLLLSTLLLHSHALTQQQGRQGDLDDTDAQEDAIEAIEDYSTAQIGSDTYYGPGPLSNIILDLGDSGLRFHTRLMLYGTGGCDGNPISVAIGYDLVEVFTNVMLDVIRNQIRNGFGFGVVTHADDNLYREGLTAQFYYWIERIGQTDEGGDTPNTHDTDGPSNDNPHRHDELSHVTGTFGSNDTYSIKFPHHMHNNNTRNSTRERSGVQIKNVESKVEASNVSREVSRSQNKKTRNMTSKIKGVQKSIVTKVGASSVSRNISRSHNNNKSNEKGRKRNGLQARNVTSLSGIGNASQEIRWSQKDDSEDCPPYEYALFTSNYDLNVLRSPSYNMPPDLIYSPNNRYSLMMQDDCNLVLYYFRPSSSSKTPLWACGDACYLKGTMCFARLNLDGTFAVYDGNGNCLWYTPTQCSSGPGCWSDTYLAMQDDGNLVLYLLDTNVPIWATQTNR